MTALSTASSGGMVGEYDMSSRGHSYDFATATLSAEDVNVRVDFISKRSQVWQGCHGTGKIGNLDVHFSRQGKHREFTKNYENTFSHKEFTSSTGKSLKF